MSALSAQAIGGARVLIDLSQVDSITEVSPTVVGVSLRSGTNYRILDEFERVSGILADERGWDVVV